MFKKEASFSQSSYTTWVINKNVKPAIKDTSMKAVNNNTIDFSSQKFFIGIDTHKANWKVTVRSNQLMLKSCSMNPSAEELAGFLKRRYPGGEYYSVYEAGFCGYWIHRDLEKHGIKNIIVNPADVPTSNKEKLTKTDKVDSGKLARELENRTLKGIYIPDEFHQQLRSLCRLRYALTKDLTRIKNRIKGHLYFYGKQIPHDSSYWSGRYMSRLKQLEFTDSTGKEYLDICLAELVRLRDRIIFINKQLRKFVQENLNDHIVQRLYQTIPGIGFISAITLYTEIIDMKRFSNLEKLASFVGLVPSLCSSGEKEHTIGLTVRNNKYLRCLLIESAWVAIKQDEVLYQYYCNLIKRMNKKRAIISVARKLLSRIRHVWLADEDYVTGVIM
jgi:transposase